MSRLGPGYIPKSNFCPDEGPWPFRDFHQYCPDWLPAVFKNSPKSVWIGIRALLPLSGVLCRWISFCDICNLDPPLLYWEGSQGTGDGLFWRWATPSFLISTKAEAILPSNSSPMLSVSFIASSQIVLSQSSSSTHLPCIIYMQEKSHIWRHHFSSESLAVPYEAYSILVNLLFVTFPLPRTEPTFIEAYSKTTSWDM